MGLAKRKFIEDTFSFEFVEDDLIENLQYILRDLENHVSNFDSKRRETIFELAENIGRAVTFPKDNKWEYGVMEIAAFSKSSGTYITEDVTGYIHKSGLLGITEGNVLIHIKAGTALVGFSNKNLDILKQFGSELIKALGVNNKNLRTTDAKKITADIKFIEILRKLKVKHFTSTPGRY